MVVHLIDRIAGIIEDYTASFRDLSNEKAMQLMQGYLAAEAERAQVRRAYLDEFAKILLGRTVRASTRSRTRWTPSFGTIWPPRSRSSTRSPPPRRSEPAGRVSP